MTVSLPSRSLSPSRSPLASISQCMASSLVHALLQTPYCELPTHKAYVPLTTTFLQARCAAKRAEPETDQSQYLHVKHLTETVYPIIKIYEPMSKYVSDKRSIGLASSFRVRTDPTLAWTTQFAPSPSPDSPRGRFFPVLNRTGSDRNRTGENP